LIYETLLPLTCGFWYWQAMGWVRRWPLLRPGFAAAGGGDASWSIGRDGMKRIPGALKRLLVLDPIKSRRYATFQG